MALTLWGSNGMELFFESQKSVNVSQSLKPSVPPPVVEQDQPQSTAKPPVWKVLIFFVPSPAGGLPPSPNGKGWLELLLLVVKVLAAVAALWKAVSVLG